MIAHAQEEFKNATSILVQDEQYSVACECLVRDAVHAGQANATDASGEDPGSVLYCGLLEMLIKDFEAQSGLSEALLVGVPRANIAPTADERLSSKRILLLRTPAATELVRQACPTFLTLSERDQATIVQHFVGDRSVSADTEETSKPKKSSTSFLQGLYVSFVFLCFSSPAWNSIQPGSLTA